MELFGVTHQESEHTRTYLKRFNKETLKVEQLLKSIALKALIKGVKEHAL